MNPIIRILTPCDASVLDRVAPGVFDYPVDPRWTAEFLADTRHHLAVAVHGDQVVGMASAVHSTHPDKPPELWINEVSVAATHRARASVAGSRGPVPAWRSLGCRQAWVATEPSNLPARRLYAAAGGEEMPEPFVMIEFRLMSED